ncbi:hypothetical protein HPB50_013852 [Hyalomma asiaticum]|uniref:Uncharacterized protein n=1 Tax=Hyalomma asiaticum TaxID=266040 RepID=A0ACB7RQW6_HYAAI|nr:hypothetical protein HPB50_013852 [Hyalomma asiaticum]
MDEFQERLIMSVALLTAVSLIGATVMAVVQVLQLEERRPVAESLAARGNVSTEVSDWTLIALDCSRKLEIVTTVLRWKSFPVRVTRVLRDGNKVVIETTHLLRQGRTYNLTVKFQGRFRHDFGLVLKRDGNQVVLFMLPRFSGYRPAVLKSIERAVGILEHYIAAWKHRSQVIDVVVAPNMIEMGVSGAGFIGLRQDLFDTFDVWDRDSWIMTVVQRMLRLFFLSYATPRSPRRASASSIVGPKRSLAFSRLVTTYCSAMKDVWIAESLAYLYMRHVLQQMGFGETVDRMRLLDHRDSMNSDDSGTDSRALRSTLIFSMVADLCPVTIASGIERYLKQNEYGVADDTALWRTLDLSGLLSRNMDTWFNYGGYPVLSVLRVHDHRGHGLVLKQGWQCFDDMECNDTLVWPVPFVLDVQGGIRVPEKGALWLRGTIQRYNVARDLSSSWLLVNVATVSYFRVQYDWNNVALLTSQLLKNHTALNVNSRAKLLDDMVALTVKRMVSIDALLGLLTYLQKEESCAVWELYAMSARKALQEFSGRTEYGPFYQRNQEICMLVQLEPTSSACLQGMRGEICCFFEMCPYPHDNGAIRR